MPNIDFETLSDEQRDQLMGSGMDLLRAVAEIAGPEDGMHVFDEMTSAIGPAFKQAIFMQMLTGHDTHGRVTIQPTQMLHQKVEAIKIIRAATGYGLKEAKDVVDAVCSGQTQTVKVGRWTDATGADRGMTRRDMVRDLRALGLSVL